MKDFTSAGFPIGAEERKKEMEKSIIAHIIYEIENIEIRQHFDQDDLLETGKTDWDRILRAKDLLKCLI